MVDAKNRVVLSAVFGPIFVIAIVFVTAGTFDYWQGILYTALTLTMIAVSNLSMRKNKELINERLKPGAGTKSWDRIYLRLSTLFFFVARANAAPIYALSVIQRSKEPPKQFNRDKCIAQRRIHRTAKRAKCNNAGE